MELFELSRVGIGIGIRVFMCLLLNCSAAHFLSYSASGSFELPLYHSARHEIWFQANPLQTLLILPESILETAVTCSATRRHVPSSDESLLPRSSPLSAVHVGFLTFRVVHDVSDLLRICRRS